MIKGCASKCDGHYKDIVPYGRDNNLNVSDSCFEFLSCNHCQKITWPSCVPLRSLGLDSELNNLNLMPVTTYICKFLILKFFASSLTLQVTRNRQPWQLNTTANIRYYEYILSTGIHVATTWTQQTSTRRETEYVLIPFKIDDVFFPFIL